MSLPTSNDSILQIESLEQTNSELRADIERMQTSRAMLEYRANTYKKFFNTNPDPIALIRLSDGRLLEANQRFEKLLGYSKDEFREVGIEYFLMDDIKRMKKMAREALKSGDWFEADCNLRLRNKSLIPVKVTASLIKHDEQTLVQASIRPEKSSAVKK